MSEKKTFRKSEVTATMDRSTWFIINDNTYDVTKFLEQVRQYDSKLGSGQKVEL